MSMTPQKTAEKAHMEHLLALFRGQESTDSLSTANSRRLLTVIQGMEQNKVAALMAADSAIIEVGPASPSLEAPSRRLLAQIQNTANNPGSPIYNDPAIVRVGPAYPKVSEGAGAAPASRG